jgi:hypothetical protein
VKDATYDQKPIFDQYMKAMIYSHEIQVGTTDLQVGDESMGHVYGTFVPNEQYFETVQKDIWKLNSRVRHYDWESLRLNVQLENGYFLFPQGGVTIDELEGSQNEPKQIDIAGIDSHLIEDFFKKPLKKFVEEPWETIGISRKIGYENELYKELGRDRIKKRSFFDFFVGSEVNHDLSGFEVSALCNTGQNDDVLFEVRKQRSEYKFAVVHLTWKGSKEFPNWPITTFYKSFDDFKTSVMDIDSADWN